MFYWGYIYEATYEYFCFGKAFDIHTDTHTFKVYGEIACGIELLFSESGLAGFFLSRDYADISTQFNTSLLFSLLRQSPL